MNVGDMRLNNRYRIQNAIGSGEFGRVFLALDEKLQRQVAIKELSPNIEPGKYQEYRGRFKLESEIQAKFDHPNIVHVYDLIEVEDGTLYLVMEYVDGGNLAERIAKGPLPPGEAVEISLQLLEALKAVHEHPRDIVHRDVKPSNILLTSKGVPKLSDFGVAQLFDNTSTRTQMGKAHPGTLLYMSLEQERTTGYLSGASDVFSLGCVLFEMLTGKAYRKADSANESLRQLRPEVSVRLEKAVMHLLAEDPKSRPKDGQELRLTLEQPKPIWPGWLVLGSALLILVFLLTRTPPPPPPPSTGTFSPTLQTVTATADTIVIATMTSALSPTSGATHTTETASITPTVTPIPVPTTTTVPIATEKPTQSPPPAPTNTSRPPVTDTPGPIVAPQCTTPAQGSTHNNPINFSWTGTLYAGQSYQVTTHSTRTGYTIQSPTLSTNSWIVNIPGEHFGEWKWSVAVVQNGAIVSSSSEGQFWFDPNLGGGGNGGEENPTIIITPGEP